MQHLSRPCRPRPNMSLRTSTARTCRQRRRDDLCVHSTYAYTRCAWARKPQGDEAVPCRTSREYLPWSSGYISTCPSLQGQRESIIRTERLTLSTTATSRYNHDLRDCELQRKPAYTRGQKMTGEERAHARSTIYTTRLQVLIHLRLCGPPYPTRAAPPPPPPAGLGGISNMPGPYRVFFFFLSAGRGEDI
ncbi:hypothetical protein FKP32DRAFT_1123002 [Trametes sanguinea]|nr:hypothetical protein FKP32DRAFT_1123002 [Trametes sanguinea]